MIRDPKTGEMKGVALELGKELARRLGVPFEPVVFQRPAEVIEGIKTGNVDITFTNASPARARYIDFTPPLLGIEQGFLVLPGSPISTSTMAELDRPEIRVGVTQGNTSLGTLSREFKYAKLVHAQNLKVANVMLTQRNVGAWWAPACRRSSWHIQPPEEDNGGRPLRPTIARDALCLLKFQPITV